MPSECEAAVPEASLADVVELVTFHTDLRGALQAFAAVKDEYFPDRYPSWTTPELRVEIRAVAVVGSGAPDASKEGGESWPT